MGGPVCTTSRPKTHNTFDTHKNAQYCVSLKLCCFIQSKKTKDYLDINFKFFRFNKTTNF